MFNYKMGTKGYRVIVWVLAIFIILQLLVGCSYRGQVTTIDDIKEEVVQLEPVHVTISAVGDVMVHQPQIWAAKQSNTYDFTNNFSKIAPYIRQSNIAIANLETTFGGESRGYSGYPMFNSPDQLADALFGAGFDVISTVNNHTMDTGVNGLLRTVDVLKERNLSVIGTKRNVEEDSFLIKDVNGIKVGITGYTYETPRFGDFRTLNGVKIPKVAEGLIDSFSLEHLEMDLLKIKDRIESMQMAGAEVIVFYVHWGVEYERTPNKYQIDIAKRLSDYGVDVIFGSHPHVLQPVEIIESEESGKKTLITYSLGNFISNQRYETLNNRYTEDGMLVTVEFKKDLNNNEITLNNVFYMPTWVYRYTETGKQRYEVIPVFEYTENGEVPYNLSKDTLWRINNSKQNTLQLVDTEDSLIKKYPVSPE